MKVKSAVKKGCILALVFVLVFSPFAMSALNAAIAIETDRTDCRITFGVGTEYPELNETQIPVKLYKVAEVSEGGTYTEKAGFEDLELTAVNSQTTAEDWQKKVEIAAKAVEEGGMPPDAEISLNSPENAENAAENLPVGLYLIMADTVQSEYYEYTFAPFLLSLPNNYYDPGDSTTSDAWVYDVESDLKPDQGSRFGDLEIVKTLSSYNKTLGSAFFVFQVEAVKDGKNVYSDVVSINFNEPGEKTVLVSHIPAGAEVTVTEIYSGASYKPTSDKVQKAVIMAEGSEGNPVKVTFKNDYDERLNSGTGLVNHFKFESNAWDWEQEADNTNGPVVSERKDAAKKDELPENGETVAMGAENEVKDEMAVNDNTITGGVDVPENMAPAGAAENAAAVQTAAVQAAEAAEAEEDAPQEEPAPADKEEFQKIDDGTVPLADMVKNFFTDEDAGLVRTVGTAGLVGVTGLTFGGITLRKRAKIRARERQIPIKRR